MFNPFSKAVGTPLEESDLSELINQNISEGYYIEYKGNTFPDNNKIGQSIASFANTYGGWYFVGIRTDENNVANNICGFDLATYPDAISKVREIVKSHIDPTPIFYIQVVNLSTLGRAVLAVCIPSDQDVPFISKNGKIYRRTHDSSEPISENNRYAIDRLYDERQNSIKRFEKFCRDERTFDKIRLGGPDIGWINVFLKPTAYEPIYKYEENELDVIQRVLTQSQSPHEIYLPYDGVNMDGNIPFYSGHARYGSLFLKQTNLATYAQNGLAVELFYDGRAKFHIPVSFFPFWEITENKAIACPRILEIIDELRRSDSVDADSLRFFDIGQVWSIVTTISSFYLQWLGEGIKFQNFMIALKFNNIWKAVPYFDDEIWADHVENFGLPVSISDELNFPEDLGRGSKCVINEKSTLGFILFNKISIGFGFTLETQMEIITKLIEKGMEKTKAKS